MGSINDRRRMTEAEKRNYIKRKNQHQIVTQGPGPLRQRPKRPSWPKGYDPDKQQDPKYFKRMPKPREEITDPKRKEELRKKLPSSIFRPRKLTDQQKKILKKHLLKSGRPKVAKKGWK